MNFFELRAVFNSAKIKKTLYSASRSAKTTRARAPTQKRAHPRVGAAAEKVNSTLESKKYKIQKCIYFNENLKKVPLFSLPLSVYTYNAI